MGDNSNKRSSPTIVSNNDTTNRSSISKKRKTLSSQMHPNNSLPHSPQISLSPVTSSISAPTVPSDQFPSDRTPLSRFTSGKVTVTVDITPLDPELQTNGFETVDSTNRNSKSLSEISEDSEAPAMFPAKIEVDIDEFFARFERDEEKRFAEKYNFDIVRDMPLEGRYEWVPLH